MPALQRAGRGQDLAGLTTRAELSPDGDEFIVNGQKLWSTSAHHAKYGMLLARTNWDVPKHRGITYFALEMHQPGVVAKPLKQMNGHASFNEVFLNDARVPAANAIGDVGQRLGGGAGHPGTRAPLVRRAAARGARSAAARAAPTTSSAPRSPRYGAVHVVPAARGPRRPHRRARAGHRSVARPVVRQEIAKLLSLARATEWTAKRARAARMAGRPPGPEGSLGKLFASEIARACSRVHTLISGSDSLLSGADGPLDGVIAEILVSVPAVSIAGGTDEIQRNIVSERVLGLPKDPALDADRPFRDVPRNKR